MVPIRAGHDLDHDAPMPAGWQGDDQAGRGGGRGEHGAG